MRDGISPRADYYFIDLFATVAICGGPRPKIAVAPFSVERLCSAIRKLRLCIQVRRRTPLLAGHAAAPPWHRRPEPDVEERFRHAATASQSGPFGRVLHDITRTCHAI